MKKLAIFFFVFTMTIFNCYSQCNCPVKKIEDPNSHEIAYLVKKRCGFAGWKESFTFNIYKQNEKYYFKGSVGREFSRKFEIPNNSPLIFVFGDSLDVILYPQVKDSSKTNAIDDFGSFWSNSGSIIYEISSTQLKYLSNNVPTEIRLHYFSDQMNPKDTDQFGAFWPLNFRLKMSYKIFLKAAKCALCI